MKSFLIILCFVASVYGGTRRAEPGESKKALSLWKKYCEGGKEGGVDGSTFIHCKHHLGPVTRDINGGEIDAETRNAEEQRTQYIFVQPAPLHFNHNLQVKTSSALEPKTVIYVRPAETSHSYNPEILKGAEVEHEKPELVFLDGGSSKSGRSQKVVSKTEEKESEEDEKPEEVKASTGNQTETGAKVSASISSSSSSSSKPTVVVTSSRLETGLDKVIPPKQKISAVDDKDSKSRPARGILPLKPVYSVPYSVVSFGRTHTVTKA